MVESILQEKTAYIKMGRLKIQLFLKKRYIFEEKKNG